MDLKSLTYQILNGSIAGRLLLRAFTVALALSIVPLMQTIIGSDPLLINSVNFHECDSPFTIKGTNFFQNRFLKPLWDSIECKENVNLTTNVVRELMNQQLLLDFDAKALCVGEGSASALYALRAMGFVNACGAHRHPFFSLKHRKFAYELQYADNSFDFVFSRDIDEISVPAIRVLEIERVLKPGGIGAMLVGVGGLNPNGLIRSATPISALLKASNVVHVGYVQEFTLVVFKKKIEVVDYFKRFVLPASCPSVTNNKPFMELLEPLRENKESGFENKTAYLPNFLDLASKKRLMYIEIGAAERLNSSVSNWFIPSYPVDHKEFNVYIVDHNSSVLLSRVRNPGITFIYHPRLAGQKPNASSHENLDPSIEDEEFDFLAWFRQTVEPADFVVLKMKAGKAQLKFLTDLFASGAICLVGELFLGCPDHVDVNGLTTEGCMDLFRSLRSSGIYVHQWWEDTYYP